MKLYSDPVGGVSRAQKAPDLSEMRLNAPDPKSTEINKRISCDFKAF